MAWATVRLLPNAAGPAKLELEETDRVDCRAVACDTVRLPVSDASPLMFALDAMVTDEPNVAACPTDRVPPRDPLHAAANCPSTCTSLLKVAFDDTTRVDCRTVPCATLRGPDAAIAAVVREPATLTPLQKVPGPCTCNPCATSRVPERAAFDPDKSPATSTVLEKLASAAT